MVMKRMLSDKRAKNDLEEMHAAKKAFLTHSRRYSAHCPIAHIADAAHQAHLIDAIPTCTTHTMACIKGKP